MTRLPRLLLAVILMCGCAHQTPGSREPARTQASANLDAELQRVGDTYRREAVAMAFLLSDPDPRGERHPLCAIGVAGRRDLVPAYLALDTGASANSFGLSACDPAQTNRVAELASNAVRPEVAMAPLVAVGAVCAFSFVFSATLTSVSSRVYNNKAHGRTAEKRDKVHAAQAIGGALGGGGISFGASGFVSAGLVGSVALANSGLICSGLGTSVGYWLVPIE